MKKIFFLVFVMSCVLLPYIVSAHTIDNPYSTDLIATGGLGKWEMAVGDVLVWNDAKNLYVKYLVDAPW